VNDAALQALGSYHGGRMLFLGLGTGLGSTLVFPDMVLPLELGDLPYCDDRIIEDFLGKPGIAELGEKEWERLVMGAVAQLKKSFIVDYVVLGGGNTKKLSVLPEGAEQGHNRNAYLGGVRLWQTDQSTRRPKWRVL
ncbi:MAG: ROK family protein, partial [Verrucomicrobia bacterium]